MDAAYTDIVRLERVQMAFGKVVALRDVDLVVGRNEIVGLIGDNGAGKSTLIKVLTGALRPTGGRLLVRGVPVDFERWSVRRARELGIETVYQEKSLGEKQPLWRNLFVGRQLTSRWGFIDVRRQRAIADDILKRQIGFRGVGIDAESRVSKLSGGERQGVAIGRAMYFEKDLIVLDEPTVALAVKEVRKVLDFVRGIKDRGKACLYIEHNLAHVHELADRLIILDRGTVVAEFARGQIALADLTEFMLDLQHDPPGAAIRHVGTNARVVGIPDR